MEATIFALQISTKPKAQLLNTSQDPHIFTSPMASPIPLINDYRYYKGGGVRAKLSCT